MQGQDEDYDDDEDEQDPDCPYPNILQEVDVNLDAEVLRLAIPILPSSNSSRTIHALQSHGVVAVACGDGSQRVLQFPLAPPSDAAKKDFATSISKTQVSFPSSGSLCSAIAAKIIPSEILNERDEAGASSFLLVTAVTNKLHIYRFSIFNELTALNQEATQSTVPLPHRALGISFHPGTRSTQLLVPDVSGAVRIYDPFTPASSSARPSSAGSDSEFPAGLQLGRWITALHTSFVSGPPGLAKRKRLLAAQWVLNGKAILVLLEDGEWGMWDITASPQAGKSIESFVLNGFLGASSTSDPAEPTKQRRGQSKLAPMTPNTRKAKAEVLFSGPANIPGVAATGGISVLGSSNRTGQVDESVAMWYNNDIYSIPSLQQFWQRSISSSGGSGGFGSLYAPGLTHITDINLGNEQITSISQFATAATSFGQMNTQRDLLVSAEHRLLVSQTLRPATPSRQLFQQAAERPAARDQRMLDAGELDLGGMDRMLDTMGQGDARPRRVGFAQ